MNDFNTDIHHRRSMRLEGYDYSQPGAYFFTVTTYQREALFGKTAEGIMVLNEFGRVVQSCWEHIPEHFPHVQPDAFIAMPNHIHGIVLFLDVRERNMVEFWATAPGFVVCRHRLFQISSHEGHKSATWGFCHACLATQLLRACHSNR